MNWTKHCEHCLDLLIHLGARLSFVIWSINLIALWHIIASIFYFFSFQHWYWHKYNKYQQRHLFLAACESLPMQSSQSSALNLAWTLLTLMLTLSLCVSILRSPGFWFQSLVQPSHNHFVYQTNSKLFWIWISPANTSSCTVQPPP